MELLRLVEELPHKTELKCLRYWTDSAIDRYNVEKSKESDKKLLECGGRTYTEKENAFLQPYLQKILDNNETFTSATFPRKDWTPEFHDKQIGYRNIYKQFHNKFAKEKNIQRLAEESRRQEQVDQVAEDLDISSDDAESPPESYSELTPAQETLLDMWWESSGQHIYVTSQARTTDDVTSDDDVLRGLSEQMNVALWQVKDWVDTKIQGQDAPVRQRSSSNVDPSSSTEQLSESRETRSSKKRKGASSSSSIPQKSSRRSLDTLPLDTRKRKGHESVSPPTHQKSSRRSLEPSSAEDIPSGQRSPEHSIDIAWPPPLSRRRSSAYDRDVDMDTIAEVHTARAEDSDDSPVQKKRENTQQYENTKRRMHISKSHESDLLPRVSAIQNAYLNHCLRSYVEKRKMSFCRGDWNYRWQSTGLPYKQVYECMYKQFNKSIDDSTFYLRNQHTDETPHYREVPPDLHQNSPAGQTTSRPVSPYSGQEYQYSPGRLAPYDDYDRETQIDSLSPRVPPYDDYDRETLVDGLSPRVPPYQDYDQETLYVTPVGSPNQDGGQVFQFSPAVRPYQDHPHVFQYDTPVVSPNQDHAQDDEYRKIPSPNAIFSLRPDIYPECSLRVTDPAYNLGQLVAKAKALKTTLVRITAATHPFLHAVSVAFRLHGWRLPEVGEVVAQVVRFMRRRKVVLRYADTFNSYHDYYSHVDNLEHPATPASHVLMRAVCDLYDFDLTLHDVSTVKTFYTSTVYHTTQHRDFRLGCNDRGVFVVFVDTGRDRWAVINDPNKEWLDRREVAFEPEEDTRPMEKIEDIKKLQLEDVTEYPECRFDFMHDAEDAFNKRVKEFINSTPGSSNKVLVDVEGDGNCFFHAVSAGLRHQGKVCPPGAKLRKDVCAFMRTPEIYEILKTSMYRPAPVDSEGRRVDPNDDGGFRDERHLREFYFQYVDRIEMGEYADNIEMAATQIYLDMGFKVHWCSDGSFNYSEHCKVGSEPRAWVSFVNIHNNHYWLRLDPKM